MREDSCGQHAAVLLLGGERARQAFADVLHYGVAVNVREAAFVIDHIARDHHGLHRTRFRAMDDDIEKRRVSVLVRCGDPVVVEDHEIGLRAWSQMADALAERRGARAMFRRHAKDRVRRGVWRIDPRLTMGAQHHAHLLQHVAIIVDARLVDADGDGNTRRNEAVDRRDAALETEIGRAIVADPHAMRRARPDIVLTHPNTVADGELSVQQSEAGKVIERRAPGAPARILLLVRRLQNVHVHRQAMAGSEIRRAGQRRV